MPEYDAILILGGGVRDGGVLPPWVQQRFDHALARQTGEPLIALSAGTVHRPPPLDVAGYPIFESVAGAAYLMQRGIPPAQILTETSSYDTIGNAYFSRVIHIAPRGFRRLLVITSAFHMPRSECIFSWVYALDAAPETYHLEFESVPDAGLDESSLALRVEREQRSLDGLPRTMAHIQTLSDLHAWLFSAHGAYATGLAPQRTVGAERQSY